MKVMILASAGGDAHRRLLHALVSEARARRHEVRVLAPDAEGKLLRPLGVPVESWRPAGLFNVLRSIGALRRAVELFAPDVIHAVGWTAAAVALGALPAAAAAKTLVTLLDPIRGGEIPKKFIDQRLPELLRRAGYVTCAYDTLARALVQRFGVDADRVEVLPYGVRPTLPPNCARPPGRDGPIVGFLAPLTVDRAWEVAVDAIAALQPSLPGARLWFDQGGPLRNLVKAYARGRDLQYEVTYFDDLPVGEFFQGVDLLVIPEGRDGLPYALPQALVDGVPVVAADHAGLADALTPYETGWLVPGDADGFVRGIEDAWSQIDAAWAGAQAQRAAATAAFDPDAARARLAALYVRVAASLPRDEEVGSPVARGNESG